MEEFKMNARPTGTSPTGKGIDVSFFKRGTAIYAVTEGGYVELSPDPARLITHGSTEYASMPFPLTFRRKRGSLILTHGDAERRIQFECYCNKAGEYLGFVAADPSTGLMCDPGDLAVIAPKVEAFSVRLRYEGFERTEGQSNGEYALGIEADRVTVEQICGRAYGTVTVEFERVKTPGKYGPAERMDERPEGQTRLRAVVSEADGGWIRGYRISNPRKIELRITAVRFARKA